MAGIQQHSDVAPDRLMEHPDLPRGWCFLPAWPSAGYQAERVAPGPGTLATAPPSPAGPGRGAARSKACAGRTPRMARLGALEPLWPQIGDPACQQITVPLAQDAELPPAAGHGSAVCHQPGGATRRFRPGCIHKGAWRWAFQAARPCLVECVACTVQPPALA
jgi:hypothetical protein